MAAELYSLGALFLSWGVTYLAHSTLLVAGVWLFLKARPAAGHLLRETLWKTALVGGVATASCQIVMLPAGPFGSLTWTLPQIRPLAADSSHADVAAYESLVSISGSTSIHGTSTDTTSPLDEDAVLIVLEPEAARESGHGGTASTTAVTAVQRGVSSSGRAVQSIESITAAVPLLAVLIIAAGAIGLGVIRSIRQTMLLAHTLAECVPIQDGIARNLLDELARHVPRARPVRLLAAPDHAEPAALGIRQWTIVLPRRAAEDLPADELRSLLAHELAHLVRGDSAWLCISRVVCSCLAFQPLNHLARREWQRAAEFLCDTWAVRRTGAPLALARCLTEVAGWKLAGSSSALLAATGRKSGLVDRIERLLDARPQADTDHEWAGRQRVALIGVLGLALLAWCTPRVNVVAANQSAEKVVVTTSGGSAAVRELAVEAERNVLDEIDGAKPQASGERELREDGSEENGAQIAPQNVPQMLAALDRELAALEAELSEMEPLLQNAAGVPQAGRLAARLQSEIGRLKHRRERLKVQWRSSVP